jgi:hypothetical protein
LKPASVDATLGPDVLAFLRHHQRTKDGKDHIYGSLVETVRTVDVPRQRTLCYLGGVEWIRAQARWLKSVEVFNEQGEAEQLKLFPPHSEVPDRSMKVNDARRIGLSRGFL